MASAAVPGAYNEEAFRYFLDVERRRSEISNRPFVLVLLNLRMPRVPNDGASHPEALLAGLSHVVRETDFIGWFRDLSVAGAVLTQHSETAGADVTGAISRRVVQILGDRLPAALAPRVRVRVYRLPGVSRNG
jgi:hypothetical protein